MNLRQRPRRLALAFVQVGLVLAIGCSDGASEEAVCEVQKPSDCPQISPVYADVAPIIERSCNGCHDPDDPSGPWPLNTYQSIVLWEHIFSNEVQTCSMPPEPRSVGFTASDRRKLLEWIACGLPEK